MATIKSFTSLEQSKVLAKILPLESVDMHYPYDYVFDELEPIPLIPEILKKTGLYLKIILGILCLVSGGQEIIL